MSTCAPPPPPQPNVTLPVRAPPSLSSPPRTPPSTAHPCRIHARPMPPRPSPSNMFRPPSLDHVVFLSSPWPPVNTHSSGPPFSVQPAPPLPRGLPSARPQGEPKRQWCCSARRCVPAPILAAARFGCIVALRKPNGRVRALVVGDVFFFFFFFPPPCRP